MLWYIQLIFLCCPVERNKYLHWFIKHVMHLAEKLLYRMPWPIATPPCLDLRTACPGPLLRRPAWTPASHNSVPIREISGRCAKFQVKSPVLKLFIYRNAE